MNSPKDDIELLVADLKNVRTSLYRHQSSKQVQESIDYLNRAIAILEAYRGEVNRTEFQTESLPKEFHFSERNSSQIQTNTSRYPSSKKSYECGIGKHWVRRTLKNGQPGFCRKNPKRR